MFNTLFLLTDMPLLFQLKLGLDRGVPTAGQYFEWRNLRFEVVDMDGQRVDKVLITLLA